MEIEKGIEGLLHVSELGGEGNPKDRLKEMKEGEEIECLVTSVDLSERKLSLSVKALHSAEDRANIKEHAKRTASSSKASLGDIFQAALAQKNAESAPAAVEEAPKVEASAAAEPPAAEAKSEEASTDETSTDTEEKPKTDEN